MKAYGFIRRFDDLGRISIPKAIRKEVLGTDDVMNKPMEIFLGKDGTIILKPIKIDEE